MRDPGGFKPEGVVPIRMDVTNIKSVRDASASCVDVDILINNAGIAAVLGGPLDGDMEELSRRMLETNFFGILRVSQAFAPAMIERRSGAIINVLSNVSWMPIQRLAPYSASKAAAWSLTNHQRMQLREHGVQVLGLHVGFVDTDLTKRVDAPKSSPEDVVRQTFDALESGKSEVMADQGTRALKKTLSADLPAYIDPSIIA
jgi:short-subunit dehydrogenase